MLRFFDCNCAIGRQSVRRNEQLFRPEEVIEEMRRVGIAEALVYHVVARDYFPPAGNARLAAQIGDRRALHPCWVVMPHHTGEMPVGEELVEAMRAGGVRAARVFPKSQNFRLNEWTVGRLVSALQDARIPLFLDMGETNWDELAQVLTSYPRLPVVLCGVGYRTNRYLYPLLEAFENFHVEIFFYEIHRALEDVCKRFGASRLLFGTGMPFFSPGSVLMTVKYAMIGDADKQAIAGGNLERLLQGVDAK